MIKLSTRLKLDDSVAKSANLAKRFGDDDLATVGKRVHEGYIADQHSREAWVRRMQAAMDLALQAQKTKTFPWPNAANVAFPLVTIAAIQFHSRAYPALISGTDIVKYRVPANDPTGKLTEIARAVGCYMSYQVLEEDQAWEEQHDRLLLQLPIMGCAFVKTQYSASKQHNVSETVSAMDLVMDYYAKSVESAARKTHILPPMSRNDIYERCRSGVWRDILEEGWYTNPALPADVQGKEEADKRTGVTPPQADESTPFQFLEQHCELDLDQDGYYEPYIVTFEANSQCVVRIVARWEDDKTDVERNLVGQVIRIRSTEYFTKYSLIPSVDGSIYDMGFGVLLGPLNESVNSLVNILIDSGSVAAAGGGFIGRGAKVRGGDFVFSPFKWNRVDSTGDDLRKNIVPLEVRDPSTVLFSLLSFLVGYTQRVSGSTDPVSGENPGQNTPASNLDTMVEQGLKIYSALYKRVWRSMKGEFAKLYTLNTRHLPISKRFGTETVAREWFLNDPSQVCPVADPNVTSDSMRLQQAHLIADRAAAGVPGYDIEACERNLLAAMKVDGVKQLFPGSAALPPKGPPEKIAIAQLQIASKEKLEQMKGEREHTQFMLSLYEESRVNDATIEQLTAQADKFAADAQSEANYAQIEAINAMVAQAKLRSDHIHGILDKMLQAKQLSIGERQLEIDRVKAEAALIAAKKPVAASS